MIVRGLHAHCVAADVTGSRKTLLTPSFQLRPPDFAFSFKLCRRRFAIKIVFEVTISKAEAWMLQRLGISPPSSVFVHGQLCVVFSRSFSFDIAVAINLGRRQRV
jgi:hypothetical protein